MYQRLGYGARYDALGEPLPPSETLPTMYDLPSEAVEDSGVPDTFHLWQPRLFDEGLSSPVYPRDQCFTASDLNLYYDVHHRLWYKRPDWFLVVGILGTEPPEMRLSYVMWQEGVAPLLVVELLSPSTEDEDLGRTLREVNRPPTKWQLYEQILRVPYYVVFDRYTDCFRLFHLVATRYEEVTLVDGRFWFEELGLGLGLWQGLYGGFERLWLRWYDGSGWIKTQEEQAGAEAEARQQAEAEVQQERDRAQQAEARAERLAARLRELGIEE
jgi:Uma2 family endonuclease